MVYKDLTIKVIVRGRGGGIRQPRLSPKIKLGLKTQR